MFSPIAFFMIMHLFSPSFKEQTFVGSTPADAEVRAFLGIPLKDSVDFVRWKLVLKDGNYQLRCIYGISKPSTPGFWKDYTVEINSKPGYKNGFVILKDKNRSIQLAVINRSILHLAGHSGKLLSGNGGYSYALNNIHPEETVQFNLKSTPAKGIGPEIYEGRTPCQELSEMGGMNKGSACVKLKWYIIFYRDSVTGNPTYYLSGGRGYRPETMDKGKWATIKKPDGRIIYQIFDAKETAKPLYLVKGNDNILFFTDANEKLFVGNEDFSFTLNRRLEPHPEIRL